MSLKLKCHQCKRVIEIGYECNCSVDKAKIFCDQECLFDYYETQSVKLSVKED